MYPDSMDCTLDYFKEYCNKLGVPYALQLHDKDVDIEGAKKIHYHVLLCFPGPTTYNNVKSNYTDIFHCPIPMKTLSPRGMFRYLIHADNPEKYQYDPKDTYYGAGFNPDEMNCISCTDKNQLLDNLFEIIYDNNISEFFQLVDLIRFNFPELREYLWQHYGLFNAYITSKREFIKKELQEAEKNAF